MPDAQRLIVPIHVLFLSFLLLAFLGHVWQSVSLGTEQQSKLETQQTVESAAINVYLYWQDDYLYT